MTMSDRRLIIVDAFKKERKIEIQRSKGKSEMATGRASNLQGTPNFLFFLHFARCNKCKSMGHAYT